MSRDKLIKQKLHGHYLTRSDWDTQILRMIISLRLPFRCVHNVELQRAFKCLDASADLPSANTIKHRIITRHQEIRPMLLAKFPRDGTKISLSCDGWSSKNRQSYLAINAYFIGKDWEYYEVLLAFRHIQGHHTGTRIADILEEEINFHEIEDVLGAITTDNASNNRTMTEAIMKAIQQKRGLGDDDDDLQSIEHLPCLAHVIQLAISELLGKIRITPTNEELQATWDEYSDERDLRTVTAGVPLTLAKVINLIINLITTLG